MTAVSNLLTTRLNCQCEICVTIAGIYSKDDILTSTCNLTNCCLLYIQHGMQHSFPYWPTQARVFYTYMYKYFVTLSYIQNK